MTDEQTDPYHSTTAIASSRVAPSFTCYWLWLAALGGILGASIPFGYGVYTIYVMRSQPPLPPGQAACGMPVLGALLAIVIGTPLSALCWAALGALLGGILDLSVWLFSARSIDSHANDPRPMVAGEDADHDA